MQELNWRFQKNNSQLSEIYDARYFLGVKVCAIRFSLFAFLRGDA
jgi:hypothetical protein